MIGNPVRFRTGPNIVSLATPGRPLSLRTVTLALFVRVFRESILFTAVINLISTLTFILHILYYSRRLCAPTKLRPIVGKYIKRARGLPGKTEDLFFIEITELLGKYQPRTMCPNATLHIPTNFTTYTIRYHRTILNNCLLIKRYFNIMHKEAAISSRMM